MNPVTMSAVKYRPEIDGLRTIAVIPVILFHMGFSWIPGGFIGVDVFFVISGFLITLIIKHELDQGTFSFPDFWARRIRRILPAMTFVSAVTLIFTYLFAFRPDQQAIGQQALAASMSVANIYFWKHAGDYWGDSADQSPFLHAWSLSVEEQFYFLFPTAMWLVCRFKPTLLKNCIALTTLASLAMFLYGINAHPSATFYLLPTRMWELGTGCLLALSVKSDRSRDSNAELFATLGLGLIVIAYVFFDSLNAGLVLAVVGTSLIISFGQSGPCHVLLSRRPMVQIGKLSYSLYLWHWPIIVFAKTLEFPSRNIFHKLIHFIVIGICAWFTYAIIEKPGRIRRRRVVPAILVAGLCVLVGTLFIAFIPRSYDISAYGPQLKTEHSCLPDWRPEASALFVNVRTSNPHYETDSLSSGRGIQINCEEGNIPRVVMLGDSHAVMWSSVVAEVACEMGLPIAFFAMNGGESPFFQIPVRESRASYNFSVANKVRYDQTRFDALRNWMPELVIISARWRQEHVYESTDLLNFLSSVDIEVLLIEDPPVLPIPDRNLMQHLAYTGELRSDTVMLESQPILDDRMKAVLREITSRFPRVNVLPVLDLFVSNGSVTVVQNTIPLYMDDDHLLDAGARKIFPRLKAALTRILEK